MNTIPLGALQPGEIEIIYTDPRVEELTLKYGTPGAAALDCYASSSIAGNRLLEQGLHVEPGEDSFLIGLGFKLNIQNRNIAAMLIPRSGLGNKDLVLGNLVGLIDSDYQGEVMASVWNRSPTKYQIINPLDRICQLVFVPVVHPVLRSVKQFSTSSDRGADGFGSTGTASHP